MPLHVLVVFVPQRTAIQLLFERTKAVFRCQQGAIRVDDVFPAHPCVRHQRIKAKQAGERLATLEAQQEVDFSRELTGKLTIRQERIAEEEKANRDGDAWLAPIQRVDDRDVEFRELESISLHAVSDDAPEARPVSPDCTELPTAIENVEEQASSRKRGLLPITRDEYLSLLDWTGRHVREGKPGAIPHHLAPILTRLEIDCENWLITVAYYRTWFHRVVGKVESMALAAQRFEKRWLQGKSRSAQAFKCRTVG